MALVKIFSIIWIYGWLKGLSEGAQACDSAIFGQLIIGVRGRDEVKAVFMNKSQNCRPGPMPTFYCPAPFLLVLI